MPWLGEGRRSPCELVIALHKVLNILLKNQIFLPVYRDISITGNCLWLFDKSRSVVGELVTAKCCHSEMLIFL